MPGSCARIRHLSERTPAAWLFVGASVLVACGGIIEASENGGSLGRNDASGTEGSTSSRSWSGRGGTSGTTISFSTSTSRSTSSPGSASSNGEVIDAGADAAGIKVLCNGVDCATSTNTCCRTTTMSGATVYTCESVAMCTAASPSSVVNCFGTADCATGSICCLDATGVTTANLTCSPGPTCPAGGGLAAAQVCARSSDCANNMCLSYVCDGVALEACKGTVAGAIAGGCMVVDAGAGVDGGS
jgi:hypothetical protein